MTKLVVFDLDDTIFLNEEGTFGLENETAIEMGFPPMSREIHQKTWGMAMKAAIAIRVPGVDIDKYYHRLSENVLKYVASGKIDRVRGEVIEILEAILKKGMKTAVLTSRAYEEIVHLLKEGHPVGSKLGKIFHLDNLKHHKPDPKSLLEVLEFHGVSPEDAVYVGDAPTDGLCANGAGVKFIATLEGGVRKKKDFAKIKVDKFVYSFTQIYDYL